MSLVKPALEPAAGFSLESRPTRPDRVPLAKGQYSVASRALALSTYFLSGALAINLSQVLGAPLYMINQDWYNAWIAFTKQSFGLLTMTLTQTFAPTKVIVSGDETVRGQLLKSVEGDLILDFPERMVLIANHQIYTDWLYLWWIAYCNGMHGRLYIILKESLKKIPVLGWGMQLNQFIFLKRNWEQDRPNMASALQKLNKVTDPMWLLLFPEGTNLAPSTRAKSAAWAKKNNTPDTRHVLLPRSTGLHFCLEELQDSVDYLYDCTVAYEGVPRGQYAQDIFTLKAGYLEGRPPKSVSMHWRRFPIKDIPLHNDKAFELWLTARWREKDLLLEMYHQNGKFPADKGATKYKSGKVLRGCGHMEVPIRASHWYEFLQIFAPMGILAMILYIFYGDLPKRYWKAINKQALRSGTDDIKKAGIQASKEAKSMSTSLGNLTLDSFFDPSQQQETFKAGAFAVQKLLNSSSAQTLLNRADFIQQFLSDPQKMVTESITDKQKNFIQDLAREEARRKLSAGGYGPPKSIANGPSQAQAKQGAFWDKLQAEEKSRHGSVVSAPLSTSTKHSQGTFWQDLKAAQEKKDAATTSKPAMTRPALTTKNVNNATAQKGNFYDALKAEESSRRGTVVTLSSNASTAVPSQSSGSVSSKASSLKKSPGVVKTPGAPKLGEGKVIPATNPVSKAGTAQKSIPNPTKTTPGKKPTISASATQTAKQPTKPSTTTGTTVSAGKPGQASKKKTNTTAPTSSSSTSTASKAAAKPTPNPKSVPVKAPTTTKPSTGKPNPLRSIKSVPNSTTKKPTTPKPASNPTANNPTTKPATGSGPRAGSTKKPLSGMAKAKTTRSATTNPPGPPKLKS